MNLYDTGSFFFFLRQTLTYISSFSRISQCFSPLSTVFLFPQSISICVCVHACVSVCAFYPFFRSQRQPCQHVMPQTNIETKKRATVYCWSCPIRSPSFTLGRLCELGEPSNVPRNPQYVCVCVCVH